LKIEKFQSSSVLGFQILPIALPDMRSRSSRVQQKRQKTPSQKNYYNQPINGLPNYLMNDEGINTDLLKRRHVKNHTFWSTFFFIATIVLGISSLLPGVQLAERIMLVIYPFAIENKKSGELNAEFVSTILTVISGAFCCLSTYFACRDTPSLHKLQTTDNTEDAYRASLLGLDVRRDLSNPSAASPSAAARNGGGVSSNNTSTSTHGSNNNNNNNSSNNHNNNTRTHGNGRRSSSRGRQSSKRGSGQSASNRGNGGNNGSFQSPISRLLSGFNGGSSSSNKKEWSSDRAREVASMSPIGRGLDVDLLDRRTGIDSIQMLERYKSSFYQQREVDQQRGGFRNALGKLFLANFFDLKMNLK